MTIPENAAQWSVRIANDNTHGYDQGGRWGPDYDCSSLVISSYKQAGVSLSCTYTGNMRSDMLSKGFKDVTGQINLYNGGGLIVGDVLLNERSHTAIYVGNGQIVNAGGNEYGGATGGRMGDQTGREIAVIGYYNFPWDYVLRYSVKEGAQTQPVTPSTKPNTNHEQKSDSYIVKSGDTLWQIAYEHDMTVYELARINGIDPNKYIYPGQVLYFKRQTAGAVPKETEKTETASVTVPKEQEKTETISAVMPDNVYTVKQGDSLWQIADALMGNGWSWYKIANANGIKFPYTIYPGDKLIIPKE